MLAVGAKKSQFARSVRGLAFDGELYQQSLACGKALYESMGNEYELMGNESMGKGGESTMYTSRKGTRSMLSTSSSSTSSSCPSRPTSSKTRRLQGVW